MVRGRGHDHGQCVGRGDQRVQGVERLHAEFLRDLRGAIGARIVEADELRAGDRAEQPDVVVAEPARADDADLELPLTSPTPRPLALDEFEEMLHLRERLQFMLARVPSPA